MASVQQVNGPSQFAAHPLSRFLGSLAMASLFGAAGRALNAAMGPSGKLLGGPFLLPVVREQSDRANQHRRTRSPTVTSDPGVRRPRDSSSRSWKPSSGLPPSLDTIPGIPHRLRARPSLAGAGRATVSSVAAT